MGSLVVLGVRLMAGSWQEPDMMRQHGYSVQKAVPAAAMEAMV